MNKQVQCHQSVFMHMVAVKQSGKVQSVHKSEVRIAHIVFFKYTQIHILYKVRKTSTTKRHEELRVHVWDSNPSRVDMIKSFGTLSGKIREAAQRR